MLVAFNSALQHTAQAESLLAAKEADQDDDDDDRCMHTATCVFVALVDSLKCQL